MSNKIQVRRGTEAERIKIVLSAGEPCWCTDSLQMYIGDGTTLGGRPVRASDMAYVRSAFSYRFNEQESVQTVTEALDAIFQFTNNVSNNIYWGDVATNVIDDPNSFFASLGVLQGAIIPGAKDVQYVSNYTYRVFAYPQVAGTLAGVQDPNFNYLDITASYEIPPREIVFLGTPFYVYFTSDQCLNAEAKTIRYII
jgi:hypothetical protein